MLLKEIEKNFFLQVPLRCFKKELIEYIVSNPQQVFTHTVFHRLNKKYPLRWSYTKAFLKNIIKMLEERGGEVEEDVYHYYLNAIKEEDDKTHFTHFLIEDEKFITILQNTNIISSGTTGLSTWQAGRILAEYCLNNKNVFANKTILELGCGVGLTGLAVIFACNPMHYCFSDAHDEVLDYLVNNIKLNLSENSPIPCSSTITNCSLPYRSIYKNTDISVVNLNWENASESKLGESFCPDIIVSADVVYDSKLFHPLCHTLQKFVQQNKDVKIFISCTIRNASTLEDFFTVLHEFKLSENEIETFTTWDSSFKDDCLVKIYSICCGD